MSAVSLNSCEWALTWAPASSRRLAHSTWPPHAASISGVWPCSLAASSRQPAASSSRKPWAWPCAAAACSGELPEAARASTSAPCSSRRREMCAWPCAHRPPQQLLRRHCRHRLRPLVPVPTHQTNFTHEITHRLQMPPNPKLFGLQSDPESSLPIRFHLISDI